MNCLEFAETAVDSARGLAADEKILAHADSCARCAARLAAERSLTAGLRAAARDAAVSDAAPPRVEAALLQAFRARRAEAANVTTEHAPLVAAPEASPSVTAGLASNVRSFDEAAAARRGRQLEASLSTSQPSRARLSTSSAGWWLRVAAALAVAVSAGLAAGLVYKNAPRANDAARRAADPAAAAPASVASLSVPSANETPAVNEERDARELQPASPLYVSAGTPDDAPGSAGRSDAILRANRSARNGAARERNDRLSRQALGALMANSRSDNAAEPEITTDFFPMSDASALPAMDGGHVIRVELPASALASYGLPVAADRANGRVKADVLIGSDGMARAIRFVR